MGAAAVAEENKQTGNARHAEEAERDTQRRSPVDAVLDFFAEQFAWFRIVRDKIISKVPTRYRKPLLVVVLLVGVGVIVSTTIGTNLTHVFAEWYGPDVQIGVADIAAPIHVGRRSLLYEFVFDKKKLATAVSADTDIAEILSNSPPVMIRPECKTSIGGQPMGVYQLFIIAQNSGDRTAKGYEVMISFSSKDALKPDPGIRILGKSTDALKVGYLYQQESDDDIAAALESCKTKALATYRADVMRDQSEHRESDQAAESPPKIPQLTRDTYRMFGLTRDTIFLDGTLEAHEFQLATLLIAAPVKVREFATIFHVECENCSFFYRTTSFGQRK